MVNSLLWRVFGGPCKEEPTDAHPSLVVVPPARHPDAAEHHRHNPVVVGVPHSGHNPFEYLPLSLSFPLTISADSTTIGTATTTVTAHLGLLDTADSVPSLPTPALLPTAQSADFKGSSSSLISCANAPASLTPTTLAIPITPAAPLTPVSSAGSAVNPQSPLRLPSSVVPCTSSALCAFTSIVTGRHSQFFPPPALLSTLCGAPPRSSAIGVHIGAPASCCFLPRSRPLAVGLMDAPASAAHICAELYNPTQQTFTTDVIDGISQSRPNNGNMGGQQIRTGVGGLNSAGDGVGDSHESSRHHQHHHTHDTRNHSHLSGISENSVTSATENKATLAGSNEANNGYAIVKPVTVLTNLQRGNVPTQAPVTLILRCIHQLVAQGDLPKEPFAERRVDLQDSEGLTPLMWASFHGQILAVRRLLAQGAAVNARAPLGQSALLYAAHRGHAAVVRELLIHGADVNQSDSDSCTALMYAAVGDHEEACRDLLSAGASLAYINEFMDSAYDLAIAYDSQHALEVFDNHLMSLFN